ncbi:MAG: S9 family peptidase [Leptolyngbya sp. SIO1E4]|nr:S9 family peptidase [Leptolyngbya sp. SIO1E4]
MILPCSVLLNRRSHPLKFALGFLATLMLTGLPATAEIINVGFDHEELPTLDEGELSKLDTLQTTRLPLILSDVSPDRSRLVIATIDRLSQADWQVKILNLNTGELEDSLALEYEVLSPTIPIQWVDNETIRFVQEGLFGPWEIISLNRNTGIVSHTTVYPTEDESGEILGASPDFSRFALRVYEGDEDTIYLVSLQSLDRIEVARMPEGMAIQPPAWSANGQQVVFVTSSVEERGLYERTPFSPTLSDPVNQDALGRTPPEDNMFLQQSALKVYDLTNPEPLQLELEAIDGEGHLLAGADISPEGDRILVKYLEPGQVEGREHPTYLYPQGSYYQVYDLDGNVIETIKAPALSGPLENSGRFVDADTLIFHATVGTNRHLYVYELETSELTALPIPDGSVDFEAWRVSQDGQTLIYAFSSVTQPPELFSIPLDGSEPPTQLTDINAEVAAINNVQVNPVSFETRTGLREGFLIQPAGAAFPPQKSPIVFWQQGGPGFSMTNEFAIEVEMPFNLLPNFGISVLSVPLAGREGFGPEFYRLQADDNNFGQVDIAEGIEIASQLVSQGWSTYDQLGVTGCSYGGYYSAQAIARFPDVFAAANPQCSLLDAFTEWQLGYSSLLSYLTGLTPMEAPEVYQQISPLYSAMQIKAATMIFHGSDDFLQVDMARNFHDVIENNEVPVMMYEFEGVGHSIFDIGFQRVAAQLQIDFFRQYLGASEEASE